MTRFLGRCTIVPLSILIYGLTGCGSSGASPTVTPANTAATRQFTTGLITDVGGVNDRSFNHLAYLGIQKAAKQFGIQGSYVESHSPSDYVPNLTHYAQQHTSLTVTVGYLMSSAMYQVASKYPQQKFAQIDAKPTDQQGHPVDLANVANLFFKEQESGYLAGVIAGLMEKGRIGKATHNTIAYMGGLSIPPVNRYIAGYVAGARKVDPSIRVLGGYSQSFTDQGKGKAIGLAQIGEGADILFQVAGASGLGYLTAAQQRGVYGIGVDADQSYLGTFVLTSAIKKVDVAVERIIGDARTDHFVSGDHIYSLRNGATGIAKASTVVPPSIVRQADEYARQLRSGKIVPPDTIPTR